MAQNLRQNLRTSLKSSCSGFRKLAILGIGSDLRGDDGAGVLAANILKRSFARSKKRLPVKVFIGGTAPENLTGEIKRYKPSHIIIIDTADFKERPGTVVVLDPRDVGGGVSFSTHKMPARILVDYLQSSLECEVTIVAIQPKNIDFGKPLTKMVAGSVKEVAGAVADVARDR